MGTLYSVKEGYLPGGEVVSPDHVLWAYRLFLGREPDDGTYANIASYFHGVDELRRFFLRSPEFHISNPEFQPPPDNIEVFGTMAAYGFPDRKIWVNLSDGIGRSVAYGQYEPQETNFVRRNLKAGQTFLDVGANIGAFSMLARGIVGEKGRVFAFEALPENVASIKKSVAENGDKNIKVFHTLVADAESDKYEVAFHRLSKQDLSSRHAHTGGSYLVAQGAELPDHMERLPIKAKPLDSLVPKAKVDFIKIDIEGAEPLAMKGAERILTTQSPLVMSEVHPRQLLAISGTDWRGYFDLMQSYGYAPRYFERGELTGTPDNLEDGKVYNVAFVKSQQ